MQLLKWILVTGLLLGSAGAQAKVSEFQLDNGLKLIVKEDHRAPVVVSQVWYKVGASYEHNGITGISHVLEHMMFKGTEKHPAGEFSRIISENGGRENAFTGRDYTAYFQRLEKSRLKVSFELEADRMRNLTLPADEFQKEREVVKEERRLRTEDQPRSLTYEHFNAAAYTNSPYQHPVIGWMNDLTHLEIADLEQWYRKWYAPNNATVVVVGDVDPEEVYALAKQHFGPLKAEKIDPPKPRTEAPQFGERRIVVKQEAELPYLLMGYKVPVLKTADNEWEPYALEVLASILSGSESSRFKKKLIREQQVAASVDAGYDAYSLYDELFMFDAIPSAEHSVAEVEQAIRQEIALVQNELVTRQELDRIKAKVVANKVYEQDSMFYQAMQIGILETVGLDWRLLDEYVQNIRSVTAQQVREVAKKYLVDERLTVAILEPQPTKVAKAE